MLTRLSGAEGCGVILVSGSFSAATQESEAFKPTGLLSVWRGTGSGTLQLWQRNTGGSWRNTGETLTVEGVKMLETGGLGHTEFKLVCSVYSSGPIEYEVSQ